MGTDPQICPPGAFSLGFYVARHPCGAAFASSIQQESSQHIGHSHVPLSSLWFPCLKQRRTLLFLPFNATGWCFPLNDGSRGPLRPWGHRLARGYEVLALAGLLRSGSSAELLELLFCGSTCAKRTGPVFFGGGGGGGVVGGGGGRGGGWGWGFPMAGSVKGILSELPGRIFWIPT